MTPLEALVHWAMIGFLVGGHLVAATALINHFG